MKALEWCSMSLPHAPHDQRWSMGFCPGVSESATVRVEEGGYPCSVDGKPCPCGFDSDDCR